MFIGLDNNFMRWGLAVGEAESHYPLADFGLLAAFVEIGLEYGKLRPEFIGLCFSALCPAHQSFCVVIQADVQDKQERNPQNAVYVLDGPGVIFPKQTVQPNEVIEPGGQPKFTALFLLLGYTLGLPECIFSHVGLGDDRSTKKRNHR
jgi:hypothetical protein